MVVEKSRESEITLNVNCAADCHATLCAWEGVVTLYITFQHCHPMRNHETDQLQGGNGKINSEKVSGQSSSIHLVSPYMSQMLYAGQSA